MTAIASQKASTTVRTPGWAVGAMLILVLGWTYSGTLMCGAQMQGVGGSGGDSGSPLYIHTTSNTIYAVGINFGGDGAGNGLMTRIGDVLPRMPGFSLVTS